MKKTLLITITVLGFVISFILGFYLNTNENLPIDDNKAEIEVNADTTSHDTITVKNDSLKLGAFSISLSVKDLKVSKQFYENFGFEILGGGMEKNYLIMKNENSIIGLFQGMFKGNILTFNPGWDESGDEIESFHDVRDIQEHLKNKGIEIGSEIDLTTTGPASLIITDPDSNVIFIDQHR